VPGKGFHRQGLARASWAIRGGGTGPLGGAFTPSGTRPKGIIAVYTEESEKSAASALSQVIEWMRPLERETRLEDSAVLRNPEQFRRFVSVGG